MLAVISLPGRTAVSLLLLFHTYLNKKFMLIRQFCPKLWWNVDNMKIKMLQTYKSSFCCTYSNKKDCKRLRQLLLQYLHRYKINEYDLMGI